jgi:tetratricopeptide (TPR) repeat protein
MHVSRNSASLSHRGLLTPILLAVWAMAMFSDSSWGQAGVGQFGTLGGVEPGGQYPPPQYYVGLDAFRSGDIESALDLFEQSYRSSRRDVRGRMIEAIPSLAMLAECHWQIGNLKTAKELIDQAFDIAIRYRGWLGRIDWTKALQTGTARTVPQGLWPEAASVRLAPVADQLMIGSGQPLTEARLLAGGAIEEPNLRSMDLVEIMRGLAVASHRRRVILGPLAKDDPLAAGLLDATKFPAGLQIPIARTLIGALRTTGYASVLDDKRALEEAAENAMFSGAAHPLSAITTLSQVYALAGSDQAATAAPLALNLAHASAALRQDEFIGESLQLAAGCATVEQAAVVRQTASMIANAMQRRSRLATLHSLIAGADASITCGDLETATTMLTQAQTLSSRRDVVLPRLNAYAAYVRARLAAGRGASIGYTQPTELDEAITQMESFTLNLNIRRQPLISMPRVFQLAMIRQSIGTSLGGATSDALLQEYCDEPPVALWRRDPVDALTAVTVDRSLEHTARVNLAVSAGYAEKALVAIDQMLAARFAQRLALGGRVAQVRAIARGDDQWLGPAVVDFRNQAPAAVKELRAAVIAAADPNLQQIENLEAKACAAALSRVALPAVVPPTIEEKRSVAQLPDRTAMLTFTFVGNRLIGTLSHQGKTSMWNVASAARISTGVAQVTRGFGAGRTRGNRLPEDESWKEDAVKLRRLLLPDDSTITADQFDHLIVVPDGSLWYLPFEILPLGEADSRLMGDEIAIRYAPTPGLAIKPAALPSAQRAVGLAADAFFAPRDKELNESIVQSIVDVVNECVKLPDDQETPTSLLGKKIGHLVVVAPRIPNPQNLLLTSLASYDQASPYGTLAAWMRFPAQVPTTVVLFGYRSGADAGQLGSGEELFVPLMALHAAGVRSVMISRWAVGGESSALALRELLQELPFIGLNEAWSRARMVLRRTELNPAAEPLLLKAEHARESLTGEEPLFWAGYLVSSPPNATDP